MEKVVLNESQAIEIENFKKLGHSLEDWVNNKSNPIEPHSVIYELSLDEMARVLYRTDSYVVVQPDFKAGDKIIKMDGKAFKSGLYIETVTTNSEYALLNLGLSTGWNINSECVRYATEEEIYWLETLGRKEVGYFIYTDVFIDGDGEAHLLNGVHPSDGHRSIEDAEYWYNTGFFKGLYPAESFKRYPQEVN